MDGKSASTAFEIVDDDDDEIIITNERLGKSAETALEIKDEEKPPSLSTVDALMFSADSRRIPGRLSNDRNSNPQYTPPPKVANLVITSRPEQISQLRRQHIPPRYPIAMASQSTRFNPGSKRASPAGPRAGPSKRPRYETTPAAGGRSSLTVPQPNPTPRVLSLKRKKGDTIDQDCSSEDESLSLNTKRQREHTASPQPTNSSLEDQYGGSDSDFLVEDQLLGEHDLDYIENIDSVPEPSPDETPSPSLSPPSSPFRSLSIIDNTDPRAQQALDALEWTPRPETRPAGGFLLRSGPAPRPQPRPQSDTPSKYIWDVLKVLSRVAKENEKPCTTEPMSVYTSRPATKLRTHLHSNFLKCTGQFRCTRGPNVIQQSAGAVLAASCTAEGEPRESKVEEELIDPDNTSGLIGWWNNSEVLLNAHSRRLKRDSPSGPRTVVKYYSVNDIQFSPMRPTLFVTAGSDKTVQVWDLDHSTYAGMRESPSRRSLEPITSMSYHGIPTCLRFKPGSSALAVGARNGYLHLHPQLGCQAESVVVSPQGDYVEHVVWGTNRTDKMVFVSTDFRKTRDRGYHVAFHTREDQIQQAYNISATGSGEALAISSAGDRLALVTHRSSKGKDTFVMELFHVNDKKRTCDTEDLHTMSTSDMLTTASFSPDDIYIACAGQADLLQIYDSRFISRGPVQTFSHKQKGKMLSSRKEQLGIIEARWTKGYGSPFDSRLGIVSGGGDGCIRLWDVSRSAEDHTNGEAIARLERDVGHFSLGRIHRNELALVAGDCDGKVSMFNLRGSDPESFYY